MGYIAITSKSKDLEVLKTSETLFLKKMCVYTFFELEVGLRNHPSCSDTRKNNNTFNISKPSLTVAFKGKVENAYNSKSIVVSPPFLHWYYSQKKVTSLGAGSYLSMNDIKTKVVDCSVKVEHNRGSDISLVHLNLDFEPNEDQPVTSVHTFFTFVSRSQIVHHRGSVLAESRYFDKKLCPMGTLVENVFLPHERVPVRKIYCWFVMPKGFIAFDYTSFGSLAPRDARIGEPEYRILLQNTSLIHRIWNWFSDYLLGRPQIMNYVLPERMITYNNSIGNDNKWDEIRLFVACSGFPLGAFFLYAAGIASIVGAIIAISCFRH